MPVIHQYSQYSKSLEELKLVITEWRKAVLTFPQSVELGWTLARIQAGFCQHVNAKIWMKPPQFKIRNQF